MAPQQKELDVQDTLTPSDIKNTEPSTKNESAVVVEHPAVVDAASEEIRQLMKTHGSIDATKCLEIITHKSIIVNEVTSHFPGAIASSQVLAKVAPVLEKRGYNDNNVLFAQSVCPDEINHEQGDLTDLFIKHWGEVFHMGGLAGIPFTGATGFGAFSHHVPDNGHCLVLMAPHIGLDDASTFGKYAREGQCGPAGTACGAAVGAFNHCCAGKALPDLATCPNDYQMAYLMNQLAPHTAEIQAAGAPNAQQAQLAQTTHTIAKTMLDGIVNVDFGSDNSTLVILTGIQINMPPPFEDYFQPLHFYVIDKQGEKIDLFEETFLKETTNDEAEC